MLDGLAAVQHVDAPDHLVRGAEAEPGHDGPHLLGNEEEVVDDVLWLACELLPQIRVLRRYAHRAGVQVALPQHDAAHRDERSRGEAELLGPQQARDRHVPAGLELSVGLHDDPSPEVVGHEDLLGLGDAKLPGQARILNGRLRRCSRAAAVAADKDDVGVCFGHPGGDGAHAYPRPLA